MAETGKVYIVGAGPGDPDLLTLRALRLIRSADVILYDRLVSPEILARSRPDAQCIYVGKHPGRQECSQEEIFRLMLDHARRGRSVVRLKGGDPMIFGRGGEELVFLAEHDIAVEVVPGVSSATALPALAGIPLTFRGLASSFAVTTGHCRDGERQDWGRYTAIQTLVILMGVGDRERIAQALIAAGRDRETPSAFLEAGGRVVESSLGEVRAGRVQVLPPAVWVVGEVVRLRARVAPLLTAAVAEALPVLAR